ncbi:MAG: leucine-rich repeat protein [Dorea sp.]|nr:leucine-rich repeat protein [Dorea sp.]
MRRREKKIFSAVFVIVMTYCAIFLAGMLCQNGSNTVQAADSISREEWIHTLVDTFQMKIEGELVPDDYYKDVSESTVTYYRDILTAVNFGVIDLEAGEEFKPKDPVTREFAAQTLNFCLGYELEENAQYTMNDQDSLKYIQSDQVALNQGWFTLIDGAFQPDKAVTEAEKTSMVAFAKSVLAASEIDENHKNTYEFAEGVIVVPEEISVELTEDHKVLIYDHSVELAEGDTFAVFSNGLAYVYKAVGIASKSYGIEVQTEDVDYDTVVKKYDAEGVIEANLGDFVPASDDIIMDIKYADGTVEENADTSKRARAARIEGTKWLKEIKLTQKIGNGKIACTVSNIEVRYRTDSLRGEYLFSVSGKAKVEGTVSGKKSKTVHVGHLRIYGIGLVNVDMIFSAEGSITVNFTSGFSTGVEKVRGQGVRTIKNFSASKWRISMKTELREACRVSFVIEIPAVAKGTVYGELGIKAAVDVEVYLDGKKPKTCMDLDAYMYAEIGYSLTVFGQRVTSGTIPIYTASDSPIRVCYHIEDGKQVAACKRPESSSRVGKGKYYTLGDASGTYSSGCFIAPAEGEVVPTFEYTVDNDGNATITKYNGNTYALTIPEELDGYPVVGIGKAAFKRKTSLGAVVIPDGVTKIAAEAFSNCGNLNSVSLPNGLVELEGAAFEACQELDLIVIPKSLVKCKYAFLGSGGIIGPFGYCSSLRNVIFEEGIKAIPEEIFYGCTGLREVKIPDTVTKIGKEAFMDCVNIERVDTGASVTEIGIRAFANCKSISELKLSKQLVYMDGEAFVNCISLKEIEIPKTLAKCGHAFLSNGGAIGPFGYCSNLTNVIFEEGITMVPEEIFLGCTGLREVRIPNTVMEIGANAFRECTNLEKAVLPNGLVAIYGSAFSNCSNLLEINIPDSVTSMGTYTFESCTAMKKVHLPNKRVTIAEGMFSGCTSLVEINWPDTVETVGVNAFKNCASLPEVHLPANVKTIGNNAFSGCTALKKFVFSDQVREIGANAFSNCDALTEIVLPDSLRTLGDAAFSSCDLLATVDLGAGVRVIPASCFYENPVLEKIILPQQVTAVRANAFKNCTKLTGITMNRNITAIDATAFSYPDRTTIYGVAGTYPETFAKENGFSFSVLNVPAKSIKLSQASRVARGGTLQLTAKITPQDSSDELTWTSTDEGILTVDKTGLIKGVKTGTASITAMAGDVVETLDITVYEKVTGIGLNVTSKEVTIGNILQLSATVYPNNADNKKVKWSSSDTKVATVTANGRVTAIAYGTATITATTEDGGYTRSCTLTVKPVSVTGISLNTKSADVGIGGSCQLIAEILPENATNKEVTWTSSKPEIAEVKDGLVTGIREGTAIIIVKSKDGAKTASCTITVKNLTVTGITLDRRKLDMEINETYRLIPSISPTGANNQNVTWASDNEEVAAVSDGTVTAKKVGTAIITATTEDGSYTAACTVTVTEPAPGQNVTGVTLSKETLSIEEGNCALLEAFVEPETAKNQTVTWSTSDEEIAEVDPETGIVSGVAEGTTTITATTEDGGYTADCEVTVTAMAEDTVPVENVSVIPSEGDLSQDQTIEAGKQFVLSAEVYPADATNQKVIWLSSNKEVATVTQEGTVTAVGAGEVTLMAISENGGRRVEYKIQVLPAKVQVTDIQLGKTQLSLNIGDQEKLTAEILPEEAADTPLIWKSDHEEVATVDSNGVVTATGEGTAVITVMAEDESEVTAQCTVQVSKKTNPPVDPDKPDDPNPPVDPDKPDDPNPPVDPDKPVTPVNPGTSGRPGTTGGNNRPSLSVGSKKKLSSGTYKITANSAKKEVTFVKPASTGKKSVTVPATVKIDGQTFKVTGIEAKAFKNNKKLKSVSIGKNVKKIGKEAFSGCKKLSKVTIKGTALKSIGRNTFKNINKKAVFKVPRKKMKQYKKLLGSKTGYKKTMKLK